VAVRKRGMQKEITKARRTPGLGVVVLSLCFVAVVATQWQGKQAVRSVEIVGASELSYTIIDSLTKSLVGKHLSEVSFAEVREKLLGIPFLASASVYQQTASRLGVLVVEREPVAVLLSAYGDVTYVDATGAILPSGRLPYHRCLPVVRSASGSELTSEQVSSLARLVCLLPSTLGPQLTSYVSEIVLDANRSELLVMTDGAQWRMRLTDPDQLRDALRSASALVRSESTALHQQRYHEVDLRWAGQIVVRAIHRAEPVV
jgi:cell division septal protein FtsQ